MLENVTLRGKVKYGVILAFAALNDAVDLLGLVSPLTEAVLDIILALIILLMLRKSSPLVFLIAVLDAIPRVDLAPFWTLYAIYTILGEIEEKERQKQPEKISKKRVKVKVE